MANPRVFISSTCYDLAEVRDVLVDFVASYGFDAVLSERGDVFYHPDIHTHESCLNEVGNCQLMILIIGGRFGGSYVADTKKSIVNAEYSAAREQKIPVFTFVKRDVHSDHSVYDKNKKSPSLSEIVFPSIENNAHAERIFAFVDDVRHSPVNNGFFSFDFARDITSLLRKQWAGMFFQFLQERTASDQLKTATSLLKNISIAGDKVEELVKNLYRHLDKAGADETIDDVERRSVAREFFHIVLDRAHDFLDDFNVRKDALLKPADYAKWYYYIAEATSGEITTITHEDVEHIVLGWDSGGFLVCPSDESEDEKWGRISRQQQTRFDIVKGMNAESLLSVVSEFRVFKDG